MAKLDNLKVEVEVTHMKIVDKDQSAKLLRELINTSVEGKMIKQVYLDALDDLHEVVTMIEVTGSDT